jgi:glycerol-3-phosphate acyltransferase PlsY
MNTSLALMAAVGGYLLGSLSFARIVTMLAGYGRGFPENAEVRLPGSDTGVRMDTVSASSVSIKAGPRLGFLTYVLDVLKVFLPVFALRQLYPDDLYYLLAATAGVVGHIWPVYHRFKGGGGISAIYGGVFAIDWPGVFVAAVGGMLLGLFVLRDFYLIYYCGLLLLIPWLWFRTGSVPLVAYAVFVNVLFFLASYPSAKRVYALRRTDPRWGDPAQAWQFSAMGRAILKMLGKLGYGKARGPSGKGPA